MMKRIAILALLAAAPTPLLADSDQVRDRIVEELRKEDYREIRISRTLLGRMRFVAVRPGARREIVVNPATGVILRDYISFIGQSDGAAGSSQDNDDDASGATGLSSGDDFDDDEDRDDDDERDDDDDRDDEDDRDDDEDDRDDDDDEDNSGSGSSNSGSGSDDDDESDDESDDDD